MHTIFGFLCFGANEEEALESAKETMRKLERMVGVLDSGQEIHLYDYFILFDDEGSVVCGEESFKFEQSVGQKFEEEEFVVYAPSSKARFGDIPTIIKADSEDGKKMIGTGLGRIKGKALKEREKYAKPWCSELFDPEGAEIESYAQLKKVLTKFRDKHAYIVPADGHF